jgi:hypothetical protein
LTADANSSVSLTNSNQYVNVPDASALSPQIGANGKLSLEAWIRLTAMPSGTPGMVISKGVSGGYEYGLRVHPNGAVEIVMWTAGGSTYQALATASGTVTPGGWFHLVTTCENGVACRVYVNGTQRASVTSGWGATLPTDGPAPLTLGRRADGVQPLIGTIDEVAIYAGVLSAPRIQAHYTSGR